jgi:hypothetical protein
MSIGRRTFLAQVASLPLVYGLQAEQEKGGEDPAWFAQALARMKETGRWGVVLLLPGAANARWVLGQTLWAITAFESEDLDAHRLFCETVFIVMTPEFAGKHFPGKEGSNRILLSHDGNFLASDQIDLGILAKPADFFTSFGQFIHGENNQRLVERARNMEKTFSSELKEAFSKLGSELDEERLQAGLTVVCQIEGVTPVLMSIAETAEAPRRRLQARNLLTSYFSGLRPDAPGAKVPYGCSGPHYYDPCRSCGMARVPERSRMFLKFLVPGAPSTKKEED